MSRYKSLNEFWPFYLKEHQSRLNRQFHFVGTALSLILIVVAVLSLHWEWLWGVPLLGYGFAWTGHFFIEKNRPATFKYPIYSLISDYKMFFWMLRGKL